MSLDRWHTNVNRPAGDGASRPDCAVQSMYEMRASRITAVGVLGAAAASAAAQVCKTGHEMINKPRGHRGTLLLLVVLVKHPGRFVNRTSLRRAACVNSRPLCWLDRYCRVRSMGSRSGPRFVRILQEHIQASSHSEQQRIKRMRWKRHQTPMDLRATVNPKQIAFL